MNNTKCPICGGTKFIIERRLDGFIECMTCHFKGKHIQFIPVDAQDDPNRLISHKEIRQELEMWIRSARQNFQFYIPLKKIEEMLHYVNQQESQQQSSKQEIEARDQLIRFYQQLANFPDEETNHVSNH